MSLHVDLLQQARYLAQKEPRRPKQASLRRAISTAYYALFHLCTDEVTRLLLGGTTRRRPLRLAMRRAFAHSHMASAARGFAGRTPIANAAAALGDLRIQKELADFAQTFVDTQLARHEADYDLTRVYTRAEVQEHIERAARAFADWKTVRGTAQADAFLMALLLHDTLRSRR